MIIQTSDGKVYGGRLLSESEVDANIKRTAKQRLEISLRVYYSIIGDTAVTAGDVENLTAQALDAVDEIFTSYRPLNEKPPLLATLATE